MLRSGFGPLGVEDVEIDPAGVGSTSITAVPGVTVTATAINIMWARALLGRSTPMIASSV
jgi:hypothetical protein